MREQMREGARQASAAIRAAGKGRRSGQGTNLMNEIQVGIVHVRVLQVHIKPFHLFIVAILKMEHFTQLSVAGKVQRRSF